MCFCVFMCECAPGCKHTIIIYTFIFNKMFLIPVLRLLEFSPVTADYDRRQHREFIHWLRRLKLICQFLTWSK